MVRVGLVHEYGSLENGEMNRQTLVRCRKVLELYRTHRIDKICITARVVEANAYEAQKMQEYFVQSDVLEADIIVDPRGYNTAGEIDVCLCNLGSRDEVISISSWYHCPRIKFLWHARGRKVKVVAAWQGIPLIDLIINIPYEVLKFVNALRNPLGWSKVYRARDAS